MPITFAPVTDEDLEEMSQAGLTPKPKPKHQLALPTNPARQINVLVKQKNPAKTQDTEAIERSSLSPKPLASSSASQLLVESCSDAGLAELRASVESTIIANEDKDTTEGVEVNAQKSAASALPTQAPLKSSRNLKRKSSDDALEPTRKQRKKRTTRGHATQ